MNKVLKQLCVLFKIRYLYCFLHRRYLMIDWITKGFIKFRCSGQKVELCENRHSKYFKHTLILKNNRAQSF